MLVVAIFDSTTTRQQRARPQEPLMADLSKLTPGTYNVDAAHSTVGFVARHLMITKVRGRFTAFSGTVEIAPNPLDSTVQATVELGSVDTGDEGRDGHLKGGDFF